jgi:hypothetical protein
MDSYWSRTLRQSLLGQRRHTDVMSVKIIEHILWSAAPVEGTAFN